MTGRVNIKTDASHNPNGDIGMGYIAQVDGQEYEGRGYIQRKCTSTKAEMLSTAWGIHNLTSKLDINPSEYMLVVSTDCQSTVNKFDDGYESKEMRIIKYYKTMYDKMMMFWIPRESNHKADAIAKTMLDRGKDD